jgi:hypothetical protein
MPDGLNDDEFDSLGAEYVLGTLDAHERTRANVLLDVDHAFRAKVRVWERRLGELHLMVEPVEPDRQIWERIRGKLSPAPAAAPSPVAVPAPVAKAADIERQIAEDLVITPDPVAELERALEQVRAQEAGRVQAAPERVPEPAPSPKFEPAPELARTSAPEMVSRGPPTIPAPLEPWSLATEPRGTAAGPRVVAVEPRRNRGAVEDDVVPAPATDGRRGLLGWRLAALFMTLVAALLGGLISAWRYAPDRLPPQLRAATVLNLTQAPNLPRKTPAPPGSEFDE